MKKMILWPLTLTLLTASLFSCGKKEDGDINEWVGEYEWVNNYVQHCHRYIDDTERIISTENFKKDTDHLFIYADKTWKIVDSKGLGPKGTIRCYKDYINLLDFSMDYRIEANYEFRFYLEESTNRTYLRYYRDESEGRITGDYDFNIRSVCFWLK